MVCAACTADVPDDDLFCENCGVRLGTAEKATSLCTCGAAESDVDEDGFCLCCGRRVRRPASDHIEVLLGPGFAAVSDRGLRHDRNEDRFAVVQSTLGYGIVVCDGVSATSNAEIASGIASETVGSLLGEALRANHVPEPEQVVAEAIQRAADELKARTSGNGGETTPSTTLVAALVTGREIALGWVGDSRAYWIDAQGTRLLTRDHSWTNMMLAAGTMTEDEAQRSPQAHAITRWLGADAEEAATPDFARHTASTKGTLLLCTDGLWNYAPTPDALAELLGGIEDEDALFKARRLVAFANESGGRDNITVAVLRLPAPEPTTETVPGEPEDSHQRTEE